MTKTAEFLFSRLDGKGRIRRSLLGADYSIVRSLPMGQEGATWSDVDKMLAVEGLQRVSGTYEHVGLGAYRYGVQPL